MESRENIDKLMKLPPGLSVESIPESRRPNIGDWKEIQGGMPEVSVLCPGYTFNVIHRYINTKDPSGTGAIVPTSRAVLEGWECKTVTYKINDRYVDFPVAMLWSKHGKPCEQRSLSMGGDGYKRVKVNPII